MTNIQKALEQHQKGNFKEAEELYLKELSENPNSLDGNNLLGLLYFQNNELDKAENHIKKAYELNNKLYIYGFEYISDVGDIVPSLSEKIYIFNKINGNFYFIFPKEGRFASLIICFIID